MRGKSWLSFVKKRRRHASQRRESFTGSTSEDRYGIGIVELLEDRTLLASATGDAAQTILLDHEGAANVQYDGPVVASNLEILAFDLSMFDRQGTESEVISSIAQELNDRFSADGVRFVTAAPAAGTYSTIYIGGDHSAFAAYGSYYGLAEQNDWGNLDPDDEALVFSDSIALANRGSYDSFLQHLSMVVEREASRLLGRLVITEIESTGSPLDEVASRDDPRFWHFPVGDPSTGTGSQEDSSGWYHSQGFGDNASATQLGHLGLDLSIPGDADFGKFVHAAAPGEVVWVGQPSGWVGTTIIIRHDTEEAGWDKDVYSSYSHLQANVLVSVGTHVLRGQQIGTVGSYPGAGDHLHFEIGWGGNVATSAGPGYRGFGFTSSTMDHPSYPGRVWKDPAEHIQDNPATLPTIHSLYASPSSAQPGDNVTINWSTTGVTDHFGVYLEETNGSPVLEISTNVNGNESGIQWQIPGGLQPGSYRLKLVAWGSNSHPDFRSFAMTGFSVAASGLPEVEVEGFGRNISDGDTSASSADGTDFGTVMHGSTPISRSFTIRNAGSANLTLSALSVPTGFNVTTGLVSSLSPGASHTFTVQRDTAVTGTRAGYISFSTNDADENPFNFFVSGTVDSQSSGVEYDSLGFIELNGDLFALVLSEPSRKFGIYGDGVDVDRDTWILIHGWNSNRAAWATNMALSLQQRFPDDRILTLDWSTASNTSVWNSEDRIQVVAEELASMLISRGYSASRLRFVGHSHGAYVANETAELVPGLVHSIVALDPAADVPAIPEIYDGGPVVGDPAEINFGQEAVFSWAFVDGGGVNVGSAAAASTAQNSFVVTSLNPTYNHALYRLYQHILDNSNPATFWFQPERIDELQSRWYFDQFKDDGTESTVASPGVERHEVSIRTAFDEITIESVTFYPDGHLNRLAQGDPQTYAADDYDTFLTDLGVTDGSSQSGESSSSNGLADSLATETVLSSDTFIVDAEVTHFGSASSGPVDVVFYASATGLATSPLYELKRYSVANLNPLDSVSFGDEFSLDDLPAAAITGGRTYIGAVVDDGDASDPDEFFWQSVIIPTGFGVPDLVGLDFNLAPVSSTYFWGEPLEASFRVENVGTGYAGPFHVGLYLSTDSTFDASDHLLGWESFEGLQGNSKSGAAIPFSLPGTPPAGFSDGPAFIGIWVDHLNDVDGEVSESNNQGRGEAIDYRSAFVSAGSSEPGVPVIGSFTVSNQTFVRGQKIRLTAFGVVDDGAVNEVVFYADSNGNGNLDEDDLYIDHGSKTGSTFTTEVYTSDFPVGENFLFARARDNLGELSQVASVYVNVLGLGDPVDDQYELNDTEETATYLNTFEYLSIPNLSITEDDEDWFIFDIPSGQPILEVTISFFQEASPTGDDGDLALEIRRNGSFVAFVDSSSPGNTFESHTDLSAANGRYSVRVIGQTVLGGGTATNPDYRLEIALAPGVPGSPDIGAFNVTPQTVVEGDSITLTAENVTVPSGYSLSSVAFYRDPGNDGQVTGDDIIGFLGPPGPFELTVSTAGWGVGPQRLYAAAFSSNGSSTGESLYLARSINVIANLPPEIDALTGPSEFLLGDDLSLLAENVQDPGGAVAAVEFYRDVDFSGDINAGDDLLGSGTQAGSNWEITFDTTGLSEGIHQFLAVATDDYGQPSSPVSIQVDGLTPPNRPPTISSFIAPSIVLQGDPVDFAAIGVFDPDGDLLDPVEFWYDANSDGAVDPGDLLLGLGTSQGNDWQFTFHDPDVEPGTYAILARAREQGGGLQTVLSRTVTVTAPVTVGLSGTVSSLPEDLDTSAPVKVADIIVVNSASGSHVLELAGADAHLFQIVEDELYLNAGAALDFETNPSLEVTLNADDPTFGGEADGTASLVIAVAEVEPEDEFRADIVARDAGNGQWRVALSTGSSFDTQIWGGWNPGNTYVDVHLADVNGDGLGDLIGRNDGNGQWLISLSTGTSFAAPAAWATWNPTRDIIDVQAADFNADGLVDIAGRDADNGQWRVNLSTGTSFGPTEFWATWNPSRNIVDVLSADFNADGRADIAGRDSANGVWRVNLSEGTTFGGTEFWVDWNPSRNIIDVMSADFNADGRADLAGRDAVTGVWRVNLSTGTDFTGTEFWATWNPTRDIVDVLSADFNADGRADLAGRDAVTGVWRVNLSTGSGFTGTEFWTDWNPSRDIVDVQSADFNGDNRADITGRDAVTGVWRVNLSTGTGFTGTEFWGDWNPTRTYVDVQVGNVDSPGPEWSSPGEEDLFLAEPQGPAEAASSELDEAFASLAVTNQAEPRIEASPDRKAPSGKSAGSENSAEAVAGTSPIAATRRESRSLVSPDDSADIPNLASVALSATPEPVRVTSKTSHGSRNDSVRTLWSNGDDFEFQESDDFFSDLASPLAQPLLPT